MHAQSRYQTSTARNDCANSAQIDQNLRSPDARRRCSRLTDSVSAITDIGCGRRPSADRGRTCLSAMTPVRIGRRTGRALDSAQKGSYDLGLPLPGPARLLVRPGGKSPDIGSRTTVFRRGRFQGCLRSWPARQQAAASSRWHVIDADGQVLGRIATVAARLLQGKHKPTYTPFIDTGDHVVVVNAAKVKLTGRKEDQKIYRQHSGYEGGLREERARLVRQRKPERLVEEAVHGMLPKTKLGEAMYRKLKVYAGPDHPHAAQKPSKLEVA